MITLSHLTEVKELRKIRPNEARDFTSFHRG